MCGRPQWDNIMKSTDGILNDIPLEVVLRRIRYCRRFLTFGFILGVLFCLFYSVFLEWGYPYSTFLFRPNDRFQDFFGVLRLTADRNPYQIRNVVGVLGHYPLEASNYLPFTHLLLYPFTLINKYSSLAIYTLLIFGSSVFLTAKALAAGLSSGKSERYLNIIVFTLMSYPLLFILDRGNIEGIVFVFLACAAWLYLTGYGKWAAACIGTAASIKGFPILFLLLFIKERRWKELMIGVAVPASLSLVALLFLKAGVLENLALMIAALSHFGDFLLIWHNGITHSVSLFGMAYSVWILIHQSFIDVATLKPFVAVYHIVAVVIGLFAVAYVYFSRLELWKVWFVLVAIVQLLPFPSYDYKLIHTMVPMFLLIRSGVETRLTRSYLMLLCLIVIPKGFWILFIDVRCGTILNPLLISAVCILIALEQYYGASLSTAGVVGELPQKQETVAEHHIGISGSSQVKPVELGVVKLFA